MIELNRKLGKSGFKRGCAIFYQAVRVGMLVYFDNGEDCLWPESGWPGSRDDVMAYCAHFC